ncbi:unnamed protein product [Mesocestoides corti]|uniref:Uncharacterized protein n=1 Tax=Mesocestoides corti TaxID=53468 RepID=A0A0R3U2S5_MESCO|nr:unnamed protein product [Mesocestoides corti]
MDRTDYRTPTRQGHVRRDDGSRHLVKASQPPPIEKRFFDSKSPDQHPTGCTFRRFSAAATDRNACEDQQRSTSSRQVFIPKEEQPKTTETKPTPSRPKEELSLAFQGEEVYPNLNWFRFHLRFLTSLHLADVNKALCTGSDLVVAFAWEGRF